MENNFIIFASICVSIVVYLALALTTMVKILWIGDEETIIKLGRELKNENLCLMIALWLGFAMFIMHGNNVITIWWPSTPVF